jgi:hypothetical protein
MHNIARRQLVFEGDPIMRVVHHLIAIAAVLLFVVGVKIVAQNSGANAYAGEAATLNVLQMQADYAKALPELKIHDMTFAVD